MEISGKTVVITGGASGIGRALAQRFHAEGAAHVCVADLKLMLSPVASVSGGDHLDVVDEAQVKKLVEKAMCETSISSVNA